MAKKCEEDCGGAEYKWSQRDVKARWETFVKFGNASATGMTQTNLDKWLRDASLLDQKTVTTAMTSISFAKVAGKKRTLDFSETKKVLNEIAKERAHKTKKSPQEELNMITKKLEAVAAPANNTHAETNTPGVYDRLTDVKKYTGAHKERFDADSGKGKGKAGRSEAADSDGYVGAYKHKGTYDKQTPK